MKQDGWNALFDSLGKLGSLHPEMRFGQVLLWCASSAGDGVQEDEIEGIDDARLLEAVERLVESRSGQLGIEPEGNIERRFPIRANLFDALAELGKRREGIGLAAVVSEFATRAGSDVYQVEDFELLAAAQAILDPRAVAAPIETAVRAGPAGPL